MADSLEEWVRTQREAGVSRSQIREELLDQGYTRQRIADAMTSTTRESTLMWRKQGWLWALTLFLILVLYWRASTLSIVFQDMPLGILILLAGIGLLLLAQVGGAMYQAFFGTRRRTLLALGAVGAVIVPAMILVTTANSLLGAPSGFGQVGRAPSVMLASWAVNGFLLLAMAAGIGFFRERSRWAGLIFPVLFLVLLIGLHWQHLSVIGTATDALPEETGFGAEAIRDQIVADVSGQIEGAGFVLPPFGAWLRQYAAVALAGQRFTRWQSIIRSYGDPPLTGPGAVCGGEQRTGRNRFGGGTARYVAFTQANIVSELMWSRDAVTAALADTCTQTAGCSVDDVDLDGAYQQYRAAEQSYQTVIATLLGVEPVNASDISVPRDCSSLPADYYRFGLEELTCDDGLVARLNNTGTYPVSGSVNVFVYSLPQDNLLKTETGAATVTDWTEGTTKVKAFFSQFQPASETFRFEQGDPYRVELEIDMDQGQLIIPAYCRGGNGFCPGCANRTAQ